VDLDSSFRERVHGQQIHTYMYGTSIRPPSGISTNNVSVAGEPISDMILSPSSTTMNLNELSIFRIGTGEFLQRRRFPSRLVVNSCCL
jgi:polyribonucleotide 5'-hydroxyl-kinase